MMFVLTAKVSKPKLIALGVIVVAVLLLLLLWPGDSQPSTQRAPAGATNDDRVAYLATFGWSVDATPVESQRVRIPEQVEETVFARYNELQLSQGFDLTVHRGEEVMRYVYEVLNYPEATAPVYATILVADGVIIGGDITDTAPEGVIHGFQKPEATPPATAEPDPQVTEVPENTQTPTSTVED